MFLKHLFLLYSAASAAGCPPFSNDLAYYSPNFQQPQPPQVKASFKANFVQHKWNANLSHITAGYLYNSPSQKLVRADEAYEGGLASSLFDYNNVTKDGLVDNTLTSVYTNFTKPNVWRGYVNSNFPLIPESFLTDAGAVFSGLAKRQFIPGQVASWSILYQGVIPVTVFVDACNTVVGYEYFFPVERTHVTTSFFNIDTESVNI